MFDNEKKRYVTVNHTVFPTEGVAEVSALYVDTGSGDGSQPGEAYEIVSRRGIRVYAHRRVSLSTFFNAFPASYWQHWTKVRAVRLVTTVEGRGLISVYKSSARGRASALASKSFSDETVTFDLPVTSFIDGGSYWFDIAAGGADATLVSAEWQVAAPDGWTPGKATVGITTFNRPSYCLNQIIAVGQNEHVHDVLDRVIVVDQGTDLVSDQPGFTEAADRLGDKLVIIRQPNLGGSGGFSRAMLESLGSEESTYVLLLDDDAISEPEAIIRAVRFADFAAAPTIVGGGMLHLDDRSVLYTQGEVWDQNKSWMRPSGASEYDHDFAEDTLRATPELHRYLGADFNGWWMCLIPTTILREIGLSLPVFLKFDDIEYSLRAREHGYPTVCLPGVAVWHMAWHDKDPTRTWEEYFIHRNRVITGLLHSHVRNGGFLPLHSFLGDIKLLFMLQYSAVRLRHEAMRDVFRGPGGLPDLLPRKQAEIREMRTQFIDSKVVEDFSALPPVRRSSVAVMGAVSKPSNPISALILAARVGVRQLVIKQSSGSRRNPERIIPAQDITWWRFADIDSALVTSPDGLGVAWYQRDRAMMHRFLWRSIRLNLRLATNWGRLAAQYAEGTPRITSADEWRRTFDSVQQD
ncbi:galactofuranosylgalactofuranosylrhamnosyl-N-acetylglucosaminyl-diphospho-decaprenol beta-1,5/1,6-galactofuranosyltransferase [Microbacterium natoriense]|uniref:Galactofuranosylgalactofuranosylrhamnosyl-N-acetylglucosaminyl-diphospho-decaprenol beta-1,5/1,6-galactofuranosyltransferase n=1 Tax=Microbacterium natoriense TaxID=284570 RepID=A0AAW8EWQ3_9MICO|nr:glycosyltransferase [Microbacterium natoriense]MDQ0647766.1 galactofuranosylgalactofuranosylrhamnosyl-N-acetylglucosaminyl-diphospho-decaprenol beta-1,5/1,6-galactofuranosyltransferase [Microbacterium natoriense]